jgi:hypothetical protein
MAIALEHRSAARAAGAPEADSFYLHLRARLAGVAAAWQHYRNEREQESLPYALRKDIGYRSQEHTAR